MTGSYPDPSIAANAVGGGEVADGSLTTSDYAYASGTTAFDMGSAALLPRRAEREREHYASSDSLPVD